MNISSEVLSSLIPCRIVSLFPYLISRFLNPFANINYEFNAQLSLGIPSSVRINNQNSYFSIKLETAFLLIYTYLCQSDSQNYNLSFNYFVHFNYKMFAKHDILLSNLYFNIDVFINSALINTIIYKLNYLFLLFNNLISVKNIFSV